MLKCGAVREIDKKEIKILFMLMRSFLTVTAVKFENKHDISFVQYICIALFQLIIS